MYTNNIDSCKGVGDDTFYYGINYRSSSCYSSKSRVRFSMDDDDPSFCEMEMKEKLIKYVKNFTAFQIGVLIGTIYGSIVATTVTISVLGLP